MKKFSRDVPFKKWYEIIRDHGSVKLVSLKRSYGLSSSNTSYNLQTFVGLGDDTPENTAEEILIILIK